jgi:hypothetical protein
LWKSSLHWLTPSLSKAKRNRGESPDSRKLWYNIVFNGEIEMQANTKLSGFEKDILADLRVSMEGVQVVNLDNKTTIAFKPLGNTVEFTLSVMAPTEKKFRRKVGEYWARTKFETGQTVKMDKTNFVHMCEYCWDAYLI